MCCWKMTIDAYMSLWAAAGPAHEEHEEAAASSLQDVEA